MEIRVDARGAPCTPALAAHVRDSLHQGLLHRSDGVSRVDVRLGGAEGERGDHDRYCLMQVHLCGASAATVVDMGPDMHATIERAAERVGRLARAKLEAAKAQPAAATS
ncbi:MAG TPA: hypothetical protein VGE20_07825 [Ramlibacter sp.]